jgi:hypothetical protein
MKTKMILGLVVLASLLILGATATPAGAFFTNFDNPFPGPGPLVLAGVTFTPNPSGGADSVFDTNAAPSPPYMYGSYVDLLVGTHTYTMMTITFDQPVFFVKFPFGSSPSANYSINALDSNGNLLDSQGFNHYDTTYPHFAPVVFCAKGIKSVVINATFTLLGGSSRASFFVDNFYFSLAPGAAVIPLF